MTQRLPPTRNDIIRKWQNKVRYSHFQVTTPKPSALESTTSSRSYRHTTVGPGSLKLGILVGTVGVITKVKPGSPLQNVASVGDIILMVNNKIVNKLEDITQNCVRKLVILKKKRQLAVEYQQPNKKQKRT